jgi:hypothetical protein
MGAWLTLVSVAFEITVEAGAADAQDLGGAKTVAIAYLQDFLYVALANFVEGERLPIFISRNTRRTMLEMFGEITEIDEISGR